MFCIKCGTKLSDDAKFCSNCGAATNGVVNQSPTYTEGQLYFAFSFLNSPVIFVYGFHGILNRTKHFQGPHCKQRRNCLQGDTDSQKNGCTVCGCL